MKQVNVGILGATGAVGQEMIKILEERNFPVASLRPIASVHHLPEPLPADDGARLLTRRTR